VSSEGEVASTCDEGVRRGERDGERESENISVSLAVPSEEPESGARMKKRPSE
jgi:hypothetical protein